MTDADILEIVKLQLGILADTYDTVLTHDITVAELEIASEGITLNPDDIKDCNLVIMYACYLFRKRASMEGMPRMLRYALNNRLMAEKVRFSDGGI